MDGFDGPGFLAEVVSAEHLAIVDTAASQYGSVGEIESSEVVADPPLVEDVDFIVGQYPRVVIFVNFTRIVVGQTAIKAGELWGGVAENEAEGAVGAISDTFIVPIHAQRLDAAGNRAVALVVDGFHDACSRDQ